ncbi:glucosyl-3-phosphoglycerate synthase [uncultured Jatrophihabitans sp.]|uniref:glucosyl-3-phosphoglycerate synthase n=1 Tax=uncultured Jatrophihabitans sp. TaxID=1610747 RepID=UPI0035CAB833
MTHLADWLASRTSRADDWPLERVLAAKGAHRVTVVIPARDEASTVADIVGTIHRHLVVDASLVDELVVIDSDSTDDTAVIAADAGATVHTASKIRPDLGNHAGKGEALWKSQFVTSGSVVVFVDADLTSWGTHFVTGLLGPLLTDPAVVLVKGFYDRTLDDGSGNHTPQGGRVTELVARPLIAALRPQLARVVQPLAGEWAIRRDAFAGLWIPVGYGVEMSTLLDVHARHGVDAVAQVDLGERAHSHQSVHDLGLMASEILGVTLRRSGMWLREEQLLWQFDRQHTPAWRAREVPTAERPPLITSGYS